ncbi:tail fiber domain-containing protein [Burkholderia dolosa]|uniref:tail fiber domain-containing protein n=1 Tax=Burkholderia dolosa TaxID=152500 RepID=UPI0015916A3D|nr:tail fiber domain-containing protein [Burkholderia dolosa]
MDYTTSIDNVVHGATGHRMHTDSAAVTTAWSGGDANMVIWSLMEILNAAGIEGRAFNPDDKESYTRLRDAVIAVAKKAAALGFVPVQQGTGTNQGPNTVKIGWRKGGEGLGVTVDTTDLGVVVFSGQLAAYATQAWVNEALGPYASREWVQSYAVQGAATSYLLTTNNERTAAWLSINGQNRGMLWTDQNFNPGSKAPVRVNNGGYGYVISDSANVLTQNWNNRDRVDVYVDGQFQGAMAYTRDVDTKADYGWTVGQLGDIRNQVNGKVGSASGNVMGMGWDGAARHINFVVDGQLTAYVTANVSDRMLKENISLAMDVDSLAKIDRAKFYWFQWKGDPSGEKNFGPIAQQLQSVEPKWTYRPPGSDPLTQPLMLDTQNMLIDAMHAIQQLSSRVRELEQTVAAQQPK